MSSRHRQVHVFPTCGMANFGSLVGHSFRPRECSLACIIAFMGWALMAQASTGTRRDRGPRNLITG